MTSCTAHAQHLMKKRHGDEAGEEEGDGREDEGALVQGGSLVKHLRGACVTGHLNAATTSISNTTSMSTTTAPAHPMHLPGTWLSKRARTPRGPSAI